MAHWTSGLKRILRRLLHLLFPRRCALCRKLLPAGSRARLCTSCAAVLRRKFRSAKSLQIPRADGVEAVLLYDKQVASALKRYKFYDGKELNEWFAAQAAVRLAEHLEQWRPELVTYVPLPPERWWTRGYNQSEMAARYLSRQFHLPMRAVLGKWPFRGQQSRRSAAERVKKARGSFFLLPGGGEVWGKRVLLIDDVIATGATAADAVRVLREAGAARVYVLALTAPTSPLDQRRLYENL